MARFYVEQCETSKRWLVRDRRNGGAVAYSFTYSVDASAYARKRNFVQ